SWLFGSVLEQAWSCHYLTKLRRGRICATTPSATNVCPGAAFAMGLSTAMWFYGFYPQFCFGERPRT
ncbi:hypothetical protein ACFFT9_21495, partial [Chromobacterium violaceum]|uniref:hypothetical protein n=1 Tax=Chromobacterium violaceum TaxID=536 RepID=UPI0035EAD67D